jgi:hypothetical protein
VARGHPAESNPGTGEQGRWEPSRPTVNPTPVQNRVLCEGPPLGVVLCVSPGCAIRVLPSLAQDLPVGRVENRSALQLCKALLQETALRFRVNELEGARVGRAGLVGAIEPAEQLAAGGVEI